MGRLVKWLDKTLYPAHAGNWDDELFRQEILRVLKPPMRLLDLGAGAGIIRQMDFRGHAGSICGVDPDGRVLTNPFLDEGRVGLGEAIPYGDGEFDVAIADNVLEHLESPLAVFREVHRVLKPGGLFLAKTPNKWHYVPIIARSTSHLASADQRLARARRGRHVSDALPREHQSRHPAFGRRGRLHRASDFGD